MTSYRIGSRIVEAGEEGLAAVFKAAYEQRLRPLCLCQSDGAASTAHGSPGTQPEMYLARFEDRHIIKRMPDTGPLHDPACEHFEAPAALSGLGDVIGKAIQESEDGSVTLKLGFSLTRQGNHLTPTPAEHPSETVKAQASKFSLRSLLHYLWHEAGLHRNNGKGKQDPRSWRAVRSAILEASGMKSARRAPLRDRLYVPENWRAEYRDDIEGRRRRFMTRFRPDRTARRELVLVMAELSSIEPSRYGFRLALGHSPGWSIFTDADTVKGINRRYSSELEIAGSLPETHLILLATASVNVADVASLEEICLMLVDDRYIPFENIDEYRLIQELSRNGRAFVKGLRFNVENRPLASVLLTDVRPPLAMYVLPHEPDDTWTGLIDEMTKENNINAWIWNPEDGAWPDIPQPSSTMLLLTHDQP